MPTISTFYGMLIRMFFNSHAPPHFHVQYADGTVGRVQFERSHLTGVFEVLKDPIVFRQAHIEEETVAGLGNLDLAPEAMYRAIKADGEWVLR